jgi:hypothetical protein
MTKQGIIRAILHCSVRQSKGNGNRRSSPQKYMNFYSSLYFLFTGTCRPVPGAKFIKACSPPDSCNSKGRSWGFFFKVSSNYLGQSLLLLAWLNSSAFFIDGVIAYWLMYFLR